MIFPTTPVAKYNWKPFQNREHLKLPFHQHIKKFISVMIAYADLKIANNNIIVSKGIDMRFIDNVRAVYP